MPLPCLGHDRSVLYLINFSLHFVCLENFACLRYNLLIFCRSDAAPSDHTTRVADIARSYQWTDYFIYCYHHHNYNNYNIYHNYNYNYYLHYITSLPSAV